MCSDPKLATYKSCGILLTSALWQWTAPRSTCSWQAEPMTWLNIWSTSSLTGTGNWTRSEYAFVTRMFNYHFPVVVDAVLGNWVLRNRNASVCLCPSVCLSGQSMTHAYKKKIIFLYTLHPCSLCDRYDGIATRVYEDPSTTEDMVELVAFLSKVSNYYWQFFPLVQSQRYISCPHLE